MFGPDDPGSNPTPALNGHSGPQSRSAPKGPRAPQQLPWHRRTVTSVAPVLAITLTILCARMGQAAGIRGASEPGSAASATATPPTPSAESGATVARPRTPKHPPPQQSRRDAHPLPVDTVAFENVEGILLVRATVHGAGRDTSGWFALDTGAGFFALDRELARTLGIDTTTTNSIPIGTATLPLPRLELGRMQFDQVQPILTIDAEIVRQVSGRPVLGLMGARLLQSHAIGIDYARHEVTWIGPGANLTGDAHRDTVTESRRSLGPQLDRSAVAIPFRLEGDGKILVPALVTNLGSRMSDSLSLILDTGATKTALFAHALSRRAPAFERWPSLRGLAAPTLLGAPEARLARVRALIVGRGRVMVRGTDVDVAVLDSPLEAALSEEVGQPVDGLLGYSFLRRFRVVIDYPHRVLWLTPVSHAFDERPYEYSHVGLQLERRGEAVSVVGVATGSPADEAGIRPGDELVAIDGASARSLGVIEATLRLEGRPGTAVVLVLRRGDDSHTYRLTRRRLL